jgi:hypothetical protein
MGFFVRAVITGFAFSLGTALFKKVSKQLGLDEKSNAAAAGGAEAVEDIIQNGELSPTDPEPVAQ